MKRFVQLAALLGTAAVVLGLTAVASGSAGHHTAAARGIGLAVPGLGSPFVTQSGTCPASPGYTTFQAPISADHPDPVAELTTNGPATLRDAFYDGVDTGGPGTVWEPWGEGLLPGQYVNVEVDCNSATDVSYTFKLYDAPSTPFSVAGAVTNCPLCHPQNDINFVTPGAADYVADVTVTQGAVDLCCNTGGLDQVFASSGTFDLGTVGQYQTHQDIYLTPLAGPTAKWSISVHALPVVLSGLKADPAQIQPKQITTISYHVDGDVTLSATIKNSAGAVIRTLASKLAVKSGDNTLTWDGQTQAGSPLPNGTYTAALSFTDAAGNSGSGQTAIKVEGCQVPKVVGRGLVKAKRTIVQDGCSVGHISHKVSSRRQKGHVLSQKPRPGSLLPKGTKVSLKVGSGPRR